MALAALASTIRAYSGCTLLPLPMTSCTCDMWIVSHRILDLPCPVA